MVFLKTAFNKSVEKMCSISRVVLTVESVREFREIFAIKYLQKQLDKEEMKKQKGKKKKPIQPQFCPDAETDIPKALQQYSKDIQAYFAG